MGADEEELVKLFEKARKAAEKASSETDGGKSEEARCLEAIKAMHSVPITTSLLVSSQVAKRLRQLTKHSQPKIQNAAANLLDSWKKLVAAEAKAGCTSVSPVAEGDSSRSPAIVKLEKVEKVVAIKVETKVETKPKAEPLRAETPKPTPTPTPTPIKLSSIPKTKEATRDKIRELLVEALAKVSSEAEGDELVRASSYDPISVAVTIETAMFEALGLSKGPNKLKYRSIMFNMRDSNNPDLRRRVLFNEINPERLISMTPEEMASDYRKMENRHIKEKALFECERGNNATASTDQFKCSKCGQRKCTYYQMQTRSADEPMTTFVTCVNCNHHWKFC